MYKPYHPWRHRYRREKFWRVVILTAKILLVAESLWFASCYLREHVREEYRPVIADVEETEAGTEDGNGGGTGEKDEKKKGIYGVGFEADSGFFFWFHSRIENSDGY